eukprot:m51a1_g732 putative histone acetyltransferase kat2a (345) ;mRNA; f:480381-481914
MAAPICEPEIGPRVVHAQEEEKAGILRFELISNAQGTPEDAERLLAFKTIICKQLQNMPGEYVWRIVFDHYNHRSLCAIREGRVFGGICFRTFADRGFIEIVFCAVTATQQVKGYGTHMMNHLKHEMQREGIYHFLTYADNDAIGYFRKQGFSPDIKLPQERWKGYIKDYIASTLMECVISPDVPSYLDIPNMLKTQKQKLVEMLSQIMGRPAIHSGAEYFKNKPEFKPQESLHHELLDLHARVLKHQSSWPFREPVDPKQVPNYYTTILDPVDLKTMGRRLESREYYVTREIFIADLRRMLDNCKVFNPKGSTYHTAALELESAFHAQLSLPDDPISQEPSQV